VEQQAREANIEEVRPLHPIIDLLHRSRSASILKVFASAGGLLGAAALITVFAIRPPLLGWIGFAVVSGVVLALALLGALAFPRMRAGVQAPAAPDDRGQRLLVVADARCSETVLCDEIQARLMGIVAVHLVVPVRVSPLHYLTDDEAEERRDAEESLLISVQLLQQRGVPASGSVGGDDPLEAMTDALAWFPATQVLLAVPPEQDSYWLERGLLAKERALTTIEVSEIVVPSVRPELEQDLGRPQVAAGDRP
jgi:hypothetical protein